MDRVAVAHELAAVARELIAKDKHFFVKQGNTYTFWRAYAPSSGTTKVFRGLPKSHITDKSGDKNFDSLAKDLAKMFPVDKVVQVDVYDYVSDQSRYDIFGGDIKPIKKMYMVINRDNNIVVNFFSSKGEASAWVRMSKK